MRAQVIESGRCGDWTTLRGIKQEVCNGERGSVKEGDNGQRGVVGSADAWQEVPVRELLVIKGLRDSEDKPLKRV